MTAPSSPASVVLGLLAVLLPPASSPKSDETVTFPGKTWERRDPEALGLDRETLERLAGELGGRGCVVRDGYVAHAWGDQAEKADWYSAVKPLFSTLLLFALEEGKVASIDAPVVDFGWPLKGKDRGITFRHLTSMTSGYARPEPPGAAWAYNDFAIQLYQQTLFDRVFHADPEAVATDPARLGPLGFEDGLTFNRRRRLIASVRDFARIAWFWTNHGRWGDRQLLPRERIEEAMRPTVPPDLPHTAHAETDDTLGIGSYGGGSDHFTQDGPGIYGFNWWFNATSRRNPEHPTWPDAPADTVLAIGFGGNVAAMIPSRGLVLVSAGGDWGNLAAGDAGSKMNRQLKRLVEADRRAAGGDRSR